MAEKGTETRIEALEAQVAELKDSVGVMGDLLEEKGVLPSFEVGGHPQVVDLTNVETWPAIRLTRRGYADRVGVNFNTVRRWEERDLVFPREELIGRRSVWAFSEDEVLFGLEMKRLRETQRGRMTLEGAAAEADRRLPPQVRQRRAVEAVRLAERRAAEADRRAVPSE